APGAAGEDLAIDAASARSEELSIETDSSELALEEEPAPPPPPPPPLKAQAPPPRPAPPRAAPAPARAAPAAPSVPADLQRVLEEVEQYVSLGFIDDAKEALREVGTRYPGHAAIQAQLDQLGLDLAEEPPASAAPAAEEEPFAALGVGEPAAAEAAPAGDSGL